MPSFSGYSWGLFLSWWLCIQISLLLGASRSSTLIGLRIGAGMSETSLFRWLEAGLATLCHQTLDALIFLGQLDMPTVPRPWDHKEGMWNSGLRHGSMLTSPLNWGVTSTALSAYPTLLVQLGMSRPAWSPHARISPLSTFLQHSVESFRYKLQISITCYPDKRYKFYS